MEAHAGAGLSSAPAPALSFRPMHVPVGSPAYYLVHWLVVSAALFLTSRIVPGFQLKKFSSAAVAAIVLALANFFVRPFLLFLSLPLNFLTFGLFTFVVNAAVLRLCAAVLKDFVIAGWGSAILGAVIFAVLNAAFFRFVF